MRHWFRITFSVTMIFSMSLMGADLKPKVSLEKPSQETKAGEKKEAKKSQDPERKLKKIKKVKEEGLPLKEIDAALKGNNETKKREFIKLLSEKFGELKSEKKDQKEVFKVEEAKALVVTLGACLSSEDQEIYQQAYIAFLDAFFVMSPQLKKDFFKTPKSLKGLKSLLGHSKVDIIRFALKLVETLSYKNDSAVRAMSQEGYYASLCNLVHRDFNKEQMFHLLRVLIDFGRRDFMVHDEEATNKALSKLLEVFSSYQETDSDDLRGPIVLVFAVSSMFGPQAVKEKVISLNARGVFEPFKLLLKKPKCTILHKEALLANIKQVAASETFKGDLKRLREKEKKEAQEKERIKHNKRIQERKKKSEERKAAKEKAAKEKAEAKEKAKLEKKRLKEEKKAKKLKEKEKK